MSSPEFPAAKARSATLADLDRPSAIAASVNRRNRGRYGPSVPRHDDAVVTGRCHSRLYGVTPPALRRFTCHGGNARRFELDAGWWGLLVVRAGEPVGHGTVWPSHRRERSERLPSIRQPTCLHGLWFPATLCPHARIRWKVVNANIALLQGPRDPGPHVAGPYGPASESPIARFVASRGRLSVIETVRDPSTATTHEIPSFTVASTAWNLHDLDERRGVAR